MSKPRCAEELVSTEMLRAELTREHGIVHGKRGYKPIVTISRGMGSGAHIVAQKLAADLGWRLWDKELLEVIASSARVTRDMVETFDEKCRSELSLIVQAALGDHKPAGFLYGKHIARAVAEIAKSESAVIVGRGANFVLPDALNVRIDASFEYRVSNMMKFENLDRSEAEAAIKKSDKVRYDFLVNVFGKERVEHFRYDIWLWMDHFSIDSAAEIIKTAIRCRYSAMDG